MAATNILKKKPGGGISIYASTDTEGDSGDMGGVAGVKEKWKTLTKKEQWDCLVALRGPDIYNSELIKYFTTGVIRKEMGKFMRVGGQLSDVGFVVVSNGQPFAAHDTPIRPDLSHFLQHIREAADILGIPVIMVPVKTWEIMMTKSGFSSAMVYFLEQVQKDKYISTTGGGNYETLIVPLLAKYKGYYKEEAE